MNGFADRWEEEQPSWIVRRPGLKEGKVGRSEYSRKCIPGPNPAQFRRLSGVRASQREIEMDLHAAADEERCPRERELS